MNDEQAREMLTCLDFLAITFRGVEGRVGFVPAHYIAEVLLESIRIRARKSGATEEVLTACRAKAAVEAVDVVRNLEAIHERNSLMSNPPLDATSVASKAEELAGLAIEKIATQMKLDAIRGPQ